MQTISPPNALQAKSLKMRAERARLKPPSKYVRNLVNEQIWRLQSRAAKKGLDFDLTPEWMAEKMAIKACQATGIPFSGEPGTAFTMSFDRRDSSKGYTMENTWIVSWIYNRAKNSDSHEAVLMFARRLIEHSSAGDVACVAQAASRHRL